MRPYGNRFLSQKEVGKVDFGDHWPFPKRLKLKPPIEEIMMISFIAFRAVCLRKGPTMASGNARFASPDFADRPQRCQGLGPGSMLSCHCFDNVRMIGRDVFFFPWIVLEIEQLPWILVILFVETPILPANSY